MQLDIFLAKLEIRYMRASPAFDMLPEATRVDCAATEISLALPDGQRISSTKCHIEREAYIKRRVSGAYRLYSNIHSFLSICCNATRYISRKAQNSIYARFACIRYVARGNESRLRRNRNISRVARRATHIEHEVPYRTRSVYQATRQRRISTIF